MKIHLNLFIPCMLTGLIFGMGCTSAPAPTPGEFADDVSFMRQHTEILLLKDGQTAVAIAPAYQGRVMTSTYDAQSGPSFGWINRPVIEDGVLSGAEAEGKLQAHIHIFGGEERFWLGPEGGQFALFFKPGDDFEFSDWKTPAAIDTEPFEVVESTPTRAVFQHHAKLTNFSGTVFTMAIKRTISLLDAELAADLLEIELSDDLKVVGYETDNRITNSGDNSWTAKTGLPSIWILGMYNPSPETTVVIPFREGDEKELGPRVNDTYFGKVPPEYLRVEDGRLFFKGDGTLRSKIGVSPRRALGIAGSYAATSRVLTVVTYNVQQAPNGFVNSMWEHQEKPYDGDVINAYNDGSPEPGAPPLGPFYELETSSPAAALEPGETMRHIQRTFHIHGTKEALDPLARELLGADLKTIQSAF